MLTLSLYNHGLQMLKLLKLLNYFLIVSFLTCCSFQNFPSPINPGFRRVFSIHTIDHQPVQMKRALALLSEKFEVSHIWCSVLQCSDVTQPQKHFYRAGLLPSGMHSVCFSHDTILISPLISPQEKPQVKSLPTKVCWWRQRFLSGFVMWKDDYRDRNTLRQEVLSFIFGH